MKKKPNTHTTPKFPKFIESICERISESRADAISRRGYKIDSYAVFRYIWTAYLLFVFTTFTIYLCGMVIMPMLAVWYASAIGVTAETDALTMVSLYYFPYGFMSLALLILEFVCVKSFKNWLSERTKRFCKRHYMRSMDVKNK